MAKNKMKVCKHCGAEIAKSAKVCPVCGGKNKKPIYKRVWFWLLVFVVIIGALGSKGNGSKEEPKNVEYIAVTVDELNDALSENALNAEETYTDAYVAITGVLSTIDSDGQYIALARLDGSGFLDDIRCNITSDEQREVVKGLSAGDTITVKGKITDIGEVLGYTMRIDSIE